MKRRRLPIFEVVVILLYVASLAALRSYVRIGLAGIGILSMAVALVIETRSAQIWKNYKRNYQPGKNKLLNKLNEPRQIYNTLNVYVVWPAVFFLGVYALYVAIHMQ